MSNDPFAPIAANRKKASAVPSSQVTIAMPVPPDAPPPPTRHPKLGSPTEKYTYTDSAGSVLGYVLRFDVAGGKEFRPLTIWTGPNGAEPEWRWESWPSPRPLYNVRELAARLSASVVVCEGEKATDAAMHLLPDYVTVTSPNGSKSAAKADWSVLNGRTVTVWPDADEAGLAYSRTVAQLVIAAGAASVVIASPPPEVKVGWDAADALVEGWTTEEAVQFINAAKAVGKLAVQKETAFQRGRQVGHEDDEVGEGRRPPQRDQLLCLTDGIEFWHDAARTAYATFQVDAHFENWPVRSRDFRLYLCRLFYQKTGGAIGNQALEDALRHCEAHAIYEGLQYECFIRMGAADGALFLDLCDPRWRAVAINANGWRVIENAPIKFLRSPAMRPLPEPEAGSLIEELANFLPVKNEDDFKLSVGFLIACFRPRGPYPILAIEGAAGTGKSLFSYMLKSIMDPGAAPIRALPRDDRDLVVSAGNSWLPVFDNVSSVAPWVADALCRLATGSGFATRMLHTDRDEVIFEASRPIILNGIPHLTDRADLADRAITIHLAAIPDSQRQTKEDLLSQFESAKPRILGALLDAISRALANIDTVKLKRAPRMADLVKWVTAAEPGLEWEPGSFQAVYDRNRADEMAASFEADAVAVVIWKLIMSEGRFEGTATELLAALNKIAPEETRRNRRWLEDPASLGNRVARAIPILKAKGCIVDRRHSGNRTITIIPPADRF